MVRRAYFTSGRVSVSKPGYDVLSVPRTSDYMAIDDTIQIERPLLAGIAFGISLSSNTLIPFGVTFPAAPAMEVYQWDGSSELKYNIYRIVQASTVVIRSPFNWTAQANGFRVFGAQGGGFVDTAFENAPRNWAWIAWKLW